MQRSEDVVDALVGLMRYKLSDKELIEYRKILLNLVGMVRIEAIAQVERDFTCVEQIR